MRTARRALVAAIAVGLAGLALAPTAFGRDYQVTITNLTAGQPLTPPVAATHKGTHAIFEVGQTASVGVREIAENGNSAPLLAELDANPSGEIFDFTESTSGPLVPPGVPGDETFAQDVKLELEASKSKNRLSFVSMLICTNDGFTGLDGLKLPQEVGGSKTVVTNGYDAHSEINTEDYADIVPPCQGLIGDSSGEPGTAVSDPDLAEGGVIAHHGGIVGGSDLETEIHGWTDPVAELTVERTG